MGCFRTSVHFLVTQTQCNSGAFPALKCSQQLRHGVELKKKSAKVKRRMCQCQ